MLRQVPNALAFKKELIEKHTQDTKNLIIGSSVVNCGINPAYLLILNLLGGFKMKKKLVTVLLASSMVATMLYIHLLPDVHSGIIFVIS